MHTDSLFRMTVGLGNTNDPICAPRHATTSDLARHRSRALAEALSSSLRQPGRSIKART
jgi:hypothetical protein